MDLQPCYNASEDTFPLPPEIRQRYGPFGFPEPVDPRRPHITSNLVMGLDGRASFRELKGRAGGREVSRSLDDRWLMDFLRAHHDGQLIGASTLREEPGPDGKGWDYAIEDEPLQAYRQKTLRLGLQKVIVLTGSGEIDSGARLFNSPRIEAWIVTSAEGEKNLRLRFGQQSSVRIIAAGEGRDVDLTRAVRLLRQEHGIRTLLCEGGPGLYGEFLTKQMIDEDFRTISMQVLGESTVAGVDRPTTYGRVSYVPETAPWYRMISLHYALPHHVFVRLRYEGPKTFGE